MPELLAGLSLTADQLQIVRHYVGFTMGYARGQRNMLFCFLLVFFSTTITLSVFENSNLPFKPFALIALPWVSLLIGIACIVSIVIKQIIRNNMITLLADTSLIPANAIARLKEIRWTMDVYVMLEPYYYLQKILHRKI